MSRRRWLPCLGVAVLLAGCEPGAWLRVVEVRSFRELPDREAERWLRDAEVALVAVPEPGAPAPPLEAATLLGAEDAPPEGLLREGRVLVVASEQDAGRRVSARLARAGVPRVALWVADPGVLRAEARREPTRPAGG